MAAALRRALDGAHGLDRLGLTAALDGEGRGLKRRPSNGPGPGSPSGSQAHESTAHRLTSWTGPTFKGRGQSRAGLTVQGRAHRRAHGSLGPG